VKLSSKMQAILPAFEAVSFVSCRTSNLFFGLGAGDIPKLFTRENMRSPQRAHDYLLLLLLLVKGNHVYCAEVRVSPTVT